MAVDFHSRLVVLGAPGAVRRFRAAAWREYEREVKGEGWTEIIPLSFVALHEITPVFARNEFPSDPLDISAWPIKKRSQRQAELRFQFHTRNMEAWPVFQRVARKFPSLTFRLMTLCLDDGDIETWQIRGRRMQKWVIPEELSQAHFRIAARKFKEPVDDIESNDDACDWVEARLMEVALGHWEPGGEPRRRRWWNAPQLHTLDDERVFAMAELDEMIAKGKLHFGEGRPAKKKPPESLGTKKAKRRRPSQTDGWRGAALLQKTPHK